MKTIGITGPTGCGKTTFLQEIAAHGTVTTAEYVITPITLKMSIIRQIAYK